MAQARGAQANESQYANVFVGNLCYEASSTQVLCGPLADLAGFNSSQDTAADDRYLLEEGWRNVMAPAT